MKESKVIQTTRKRRFFGAFRIIGLDRRQPVCARCTENHSNNHPFASQSFAGADLGLAEAKTQSILSDGRVF